MSFNAVVPPAPGRGSFFEFFFSYLLLDYFIFPVETLASFLEKKAT
jgi:hypothetical protein